MEVAHAAGAADPPPDAVRALVAVHGTSLVDGLVGGLRRWGANVALATQALDDPAAAYDAFAAADRTLGGLDLVVHASAMAPATTPAEFDTLSEADWRQATQRSLLGTVSCLQAAHRRMGARGGAVIVFGPSMALVGAPGLVALATLAEAQRTLVKSAARQWGGRGLRLNWIGVPATLYASSLQEARVPCVPELGPPPPALGRAPALDAEVADVVAWLSRARGVTGATLTLDGGDWMVP